MSDDSSANISSQSEGPAKPPGALVPPPYTTDLEALQTEVELQPTKGSGPGGQRRNKVETGLRITHAASGLVVVATRHASREANLKEGFERLQQKLERLNYIPKKRKRTRPSKAARKRRLDAKKRQAEKKASRGRVSLPRGE